MKKAKLFCRAVMFLFAALFVVFPVCAKEAEESSQKDLEIVFIVDKSGSMYNLADDTIGGFNSVIEEQKAPDKKGNVYVTTVMFNHGREKIHDGKNIKDIAPLTRKDYRPSGCTALLDAVGNTILELSSDDKVKEHRVMVVIITDGYENASREFNREQVKNLIVQKQKDCGWEFVFLGANIDSVKAAGGIGIAPEFAKDFHATSKGMRDTYAIVGNAISQVRDNRQISLDK